MFESTGAYSRNGGKSLRRGLVAISILTAGTEKEVFFFLLPSPTLGYLADGFVFEFGGKSLLTHGTPSDSSMLAIQVSTILGEVHSPASRLGRSGRQERILRGSKQGSPDSAAHEFQPLRE